MESRAVIPTNCLFQGCYNPKLEAEIKECKDKCYRYNQTNPNDQEAQQKMLAEILGKMGEHVTITPPFGVIMDTIFLWAIGSIPITISSLRTGQK